MNKYLGVKLINGEPMTRQAWCDFRGWDLPSDEDGDDTGYLVEYLDGGKPNTEKYDNYVSWSPADVFDRAYRVTEGMTFGDAVEAMKKGCKMARQGWNGKHMFIFLVPGSRFKVNRPPLLGLYQEGTKIEYHAHVDMRTVDGQIVPWLCSQTDMLADDWQIVE